MDPANGSAESTTERAVSSLDGASTAVIDEKGTTINESQTELEPESMRNEQYSRNMDR